MQSVLRSGSRRAGLVAASFLLTAAAMGAAASSVLAVPPGGGGEPLPNDIPIRAVVHRALTAPAPTGADAIRVTVLGDASGALLQVRLLSGKEDGVVSGYCAAPVVPIDFKGWKTLILPLSAFTFHSDNDPAADQDGIGDPKTLATGATAVQMAITSTSTRLYFDDLAWTTAGAAPTDAPLAMIDDFEAPPATTVAAWKIDGDYDQMRSVTIANENKSARYVKSGQGSLSLTVRASGQDQFQLAAPALAARLKRTPTMPYVVYARPPFETIAPDDAPSTAELALPASKSVSLFAAPGETEPGTFTVFAGLKIKDATVAMSGALVSKTGGMLPASSVNVHVVRAALTADGPQLLMKDDREALTGPTPKVRLTGAPTTDIAASSSKQFWVTVQVPANQAAGIYTGKLVFQAPGIKPTGIPINVEVLPVTLRTAHFQYGIDLMSMLSPTDASATPGEQTVTPEMFKAELADIRSHGFKLVTLHDRPANLQAALQAYKDAGMSANGPVVVAAPLQAGDFATVEALRGPVGLTNDFDIYYRLPASVRDDASAASAYAKSAQGAARGALVVASVPSEAVYSALTTSVGSGLVPLYSLSSDHAATLMATGKRMTPNRDWWTWSIGQNDPIRNRLYAGFLLYKTGNGLYGAFPGPYQFFPTGTDPYSLFAIKDSSPPTDATGVAATTAAAANTTTAAPPASAPIQMATFPVEDGVLDTVQWEAVREGVDDIRYLDALKTVSRELKDAHLAKSQTDYADSLLIGLAQRPLMTLKPDAVQAMRRQVAVQYIKLSQILAKSPH